MNEHCGLVTAREEYALADHEAELLELPQEESKFQKQQVLYRIGRCLTFSGEISCVQDPRRPSRSGKCFEKVP